MNTQITKQSPTILQYPLDEIINSFFPGKHNSLEKEIHKLSILSLKHNYVSLKVDSQGEHIIYPKESTDKELPSPRNILRIFNKKKGKDDDFYLQIDLKSNFLLQILKIRKILSPTIKKFDF